MPLTDTNKSILKSTLEECHSTDNLIAIGKDLFPDLKLKYEGRSNEKIEGQCPFCSAGSVKKPKFSMSKKGYNCVVCQSDEAKGKSPLSLAMQVKRLDKTNREDFFEGVKYVCDTANILFETEDFKPEKPKTAQKPKKKKKLQKPSTKSDFVTRQLAASGFSLEDTSYTEEMGDRVATRNVYELGSVHANGKISWDEPDMIINYRDLSGEALKYQDKKDGSRKIFRRVRFQYPDLHIFNGKPTKYGQPKNSGCQLFLPNFLIEAYKQGRKFKRLTIFEGEKKGSCFSILFGQLCVSIGGINNFDTSTQMRETLKTIIRDFGIEEIVMMYDADLFDLGKELVEKNADARPRNFMRAAIKFHEFFHGLSKPGIDIHVEMYIGYHKHTELKGFDDFVVNTDHSKEHILQQIDSAIIDTDGESELFKIHSLKGLKSSQISKIWHLQTREKFVEHYIEILKELPKFKLNNVFWKIDQRGELVSFYPLGDNERFYKWYFDDSGKKKFSFSFNKSRNFLESLGYRKIRLEKKEYEYIKINGFDESGKVSESAKGIVTEADYELMKNEFFKFLRAQGKPLENTLEAISSAPKYMAPSHLSTVELVNLEYLQPTEKKEYFVFPKNYWEIPAWGNDIIIENNAALPEYVHESNVIERNVKFTPVFKPVIKNGKHVMRDGFPEIENTKDGDKCQFLDFLVCTSMWKPYKKEIQKDKQGKPVLDANNEAVYVDVIPEQNQHSYSHFMSKCLALGYACSKFWDPANTKSIVLMDGTLPEIFSANQSMGRTGKTIWSLAAGQFQHYCMVNGKKYKFYEDDYMLSDANRQTSLVIFDDCYNKLPFEPFFNNTQYGFTVNAKHQKQFKKKMKSIFNTNFGLNKGDGGDSYDGRLYEIGFSNYFSKDYTPLDHFGNRLFDDWDDTQWDLFVSLCAQCMQLFMKFGFIDAPKGDLDKRIAALGVGEDFMEYFDTQFNDGFSENWLNVRVNKKDFYKRFFSYANAEDNKQSAPFLRKATKKTLIDRLKKYVAYKGYDYNLLGGDFPDKYHSKTTYWVMVTDDKFDRDNFQTWDDGGFQAF